jgi:tetratricopeptide (TPR) repeat protein
MSFRPIVVTVVLLCAASAHAEQRNPKHPEAQRLLGEANRLYRVREFTQAIAKYTEGARLEDAPVFWYNLGQSHRQLAQYEEAIWFYKRYLAEGNPADEERQYIGRFILDMEDEQRKAASKAAPTAPGTGSATAEVAPEVADRTLALDIVPSPIEQRREQWYEDKIGWGLAGGGLVFTTIGVALLAKASANASASLYDWSDEAKAAKSQRVWGATFTVVGVGALAGGVVKLILVPELPVEPVAVIAPGSWSVSLSGRF